MYPYELFVEKKRYLSFTVPYIYSVDPFAMAWNVPYDFLWIREREAE
jgi:hypothetical protein